MGIGRRVEQPGGLAWFKSTCSGTDGGGCVEVAAAESAVHVRGSKAVGDGPVVRVGRGEWATFTALLAM
ncbi:DUF397 domain-containing protein [Streptomyces sp. NPDC017202]|uniref:DUF397 domain-containing protein n=1 Tax=Streptomyces sp. NPDC017202 TaxID=3364981 RepID=UPI0037A4C0A8